MSETKSLLALVQTATNIEQMLIESGGELTPELEQALAVTELHLPEKVDSYALVIDRMNAITSFYKQKAEFFQRLAKASTSVAERCKSNIEIAMDTLETDEVLGFDVKFRRQASPLTYEIADVALVDQAYVITETITTHTPDRKRILEDLKLGVPVTGVEPKQSYHVRVYANTPAKTTKEKKSKAAGGEATA